MRASERVITALPLTELWNSEKALTFRRGRFLGVADIRELLRAGSCEWVIANCGDRLLWVRSDDVFQLWKDEVQSRLIEPADVNGFRLDDYPGNYCYVASEWQENGDTVIVLEMHH